jgi:hypothetical protein
VITDGLVTGRQEKQMKARNEVGKGSDKNGETEESNT